MAGELRTNLSATALRFVKGGVDVANPAVLSNFDVSGSFYIRNFISVGTGDESLALGDVATPGWLFVWNHDATNYITMGSDGSVYPIKLKAGEWGLFRWNGAAIHAKANTAACKLEYFLIDD